ncbi:MAG: fumarylacetoacetate hydrolase family protein [Ectothiorhodospiraceae bacterium]|nr:fumarylacetoacetate hydrolase family protein [Ectothiorhodospiraceae bacterium]
MTDATAEAARLLADHWRAGTKLDTLPAALRPGDMAAGYRIQAHLPVAMGETTVGWKIAATAESGQRHIGVDGPVAGRLLASRVREDGSTIALGGNRMLVAECELAFVLGRDLPARSAPYERAEVEAAVVALRPALELPDSRFRDFVAAGPAQLAADDACADWLVLGAATTADWRALDLAAHATALRIDGETVTAGSGADVLGHPLDALTWLVNHAREHAGGLRAGEVVTTGVTGKPMPIGPGMTVEADLGVLGRVRATLTD